MSLAKRASDLLKRSPHLYRLGIFIKIKQASLTSYRWALHDVAQYNRSSHYRRADRKQSFMQAEISKAYHSLEKGLSLRAPRPDFGVAAAVRLAKFIDQYRAVHGIDSFLATPIATLREYLAFKRSHGIELKQLEARVHEWGQAAPDTPASDGRPGGTETTSESSIHRAALDADFQAFLASRHSIRHFAPRAVDPELLAKAVRMAQLAPSACNRQGARAYVVTDPAHVQKVLALQPGNRGFGETVPVVIAAAGRVSAFSGPEERNQCYVDGSLFAMTLVYALHSLGLGTCMLAWCVSPAQDAKLAEEIGLDEDDRVVMLIAVGHLPEELRVPVSTRYPVEDAMILVDG